MIFVTKASPQQIAVVNNGPTVNDTLTFSARGSLNLDFDLAISEDFVSRENNEVYDISVIGSSLPADTSSTEATTRITIFDNDGQPLFESLCLQS